MQQTENTYFQTTTTTTKHLGALEPNVVYAVTSDFFVERRADLEDENRKHSMIKLQKYDTKSIEERLKLLEDTVKEQTKTINKQNKTINKKNKTINKQNQKIEKQTKMIKLLKTEQTLTHDKIKCLQNELNGRTDSLMIIIEKNNELLKEEINVNKIKTEEHRDEFNSSVHNLQERISLLNWRINNM